MDSPNIGDVAKMRRYSPLTCFRYVKSVQKSLKFRFSGYNSRIGKCYEAIIVSRIFICYYGHFIIWELPIQTSPSWCTSVRLSIGKNFKIVFELEFHYDNYMFWWQILCHKVRPTYIFHILSALYHNDISILSYWRKTGDFSWFCSYIFKQLLNYPAPVRPPDGLRTPYDRTGSQGKCLKNFG